MNVAYSKPSFKLQTWIVFLKEMQDALRDHRTLWVMLGSGVFLGPLLLLAISFWMADQQAHADEQILWIEGIENAPTLHNFLLRQTFRIQAPPPDFTKKLQNGSFRDAVLRISLNFETELAKGRRPTLILLTDSSNARAQASLSRWDRLLTAFSQERSTLVLALRGVAPQALQVIRYQEHDLANPLARMASIASILPWIFIMAVLSGATNAALDTTAGERERGSLEPLLMNPISPYALAWGKWASVFVLSSLMAFLSCFAFLPAQALFQSNSMRNLIQFTGLQALEFVMILLPLAACVSALLMWVSIRSRSVREAQASASVVIMLFTSLPTLSALNLIDAQSFAALLPGLAQYVLMGNVLKGVSVTPQQWLGVWVMAILIVLVCIRGLARLWRLALR